MGAISCLDTNTKLNLKMHFSIKQIYLPEFIKTAHNSASDRYFFLKLAPLYSAHTELSIYAKNLTLMKISKRSLFLEQVTCGLGICKTPRCPLEPTLTNR